MGRVCSEKEKEIEKKIALEGKEKRKGEIERKKHMKEGGRNRETTKQAVLVCCEMNKKFR